MPIVGAKEQIQKLIIEDEPVHLWKPEKLDKISYLNKSIDFFKAKLEELE